MRDLHRGDRLLTRADAVQPVPVMILALVQVNLVGADDRCDDARVARRERLRVLQLRYWIAGGDGLVPARDEDPAFGPDELDAVRKISADDHVDAVGVDAFG